MFQTTGILARLEAQAEGKRPPKWSDAISHPVWRTSEESPLEAARRRVRKYVRENAQELDGIREGLPFRSWHERGEADPAEGLETRLFPVWLLGLVGLGESTWRKILDKDTRQRLRAKQKAARQGLARDIGNARKAAARTDSEFVDVLTRNCDFILSGVTSYAMEKAAQNVAQTLGVWRGLHKVAKRNLSARQTARIWGRVKQMKVEVERLEGLAGRINFRKGIRVALELLRTGAGPGLGLAAWGKALEAQAEGQARYTLAASNPNLTRQLSRALEALASAHAPEALGGGGKARAAESVAALDSVVSFLDTWDSCREAEATRVRRAAECLRQAAALLAWQSGDSGSRFHGVDEMGGAYLRAVDVAQDETGEITGGRLQTSQGAEVPLAEAFRAFRFLKLCREHGQAWEANGQNLRVGHFRIESVSAGGDFRALCHFIRWQEVARLAESLGVLGYAADDSAVGYRGAA